MIRFYFALWASKFVSFIFKLRGNERDDWPGLLANKLCPDFLKLVSKPKLTVAITGTNGKTTTSALVNGLLTEQGYTTSFNDWGANIHAGITLNLLRGVNIFNKPKVDASVLEADELTLPDTIGKVTPNYIIVTNVSKDSLRRNGHPEHIFDQINKTFDILGEKTVAILNANDPISSQLALTSDTTKVFYGMCDVGAEPWDNIGKEIVICPHCGGKIHYNYRFYRHMGDFYCEDCDFKTPKINYFAEKIDLDNRMLTVSELVDSGETSKEGTYSNSHEYPLISATVFNAFNVLSSLAFFRTIGIEADVISEYLSRQQITKIRESMVEFNGINYHTYSAKSQNVSAASTVFEYMAKEPSVKDVVLCMDEVQDRNHPTETLTWLYETDYEALNSPNIRRIICAGHMFLNHKLRMLLAGIPEERIVCIEDDSKVPLYVDTEGIESVYVLFETDYVTKAQNWRDAIVSRAKEVAEGKAPSVNPDMTQAHIENTDKEEI